MIRRMSLLPNGRSGAEPGRPDPTVTLMTGPSPAYQFASSWAGRGERAPIADAAASPGGLSSRRAFLTGTRRRRAALGLDAGGALPTALRGSPDVVVGLVDLGLDGVPYNAAVHVRDGAPLFRHRKVYLPTYGMFDEGRFFGRGARVEAYEPGGGWRAGVLICEDFWHPALMYLAAIQGVHLLMIQAAAPGRGAWTGGADGSRFRTSEAWTRIAKHARHHGLRRAESRARGWRGLRRRFADRAPMGRTAHAPEGGRPGRVVSAEAARARWLFAHTRRGPRLAFDADGDPG